MSKQFHVGLGVFVAVWNVAAAVLFSLSVVSEYTPGAALGVFGIPLLVVGGAGRGIPLPGGRGLDAERTVGLGQAVVGAGVVASMTAPVLAGSTASSDLLVALLGGGAGAILLAMGGAVAAGAIDLPGS